MTKQKSILIFLVCIMNLVHGQHTRQLIEIDGKATGRTFEGIGALSAGASSRLLFDYDEKYQTQILDLLFKPNFGASLHHLKVEIGGDVNSTDGTEPSHAHTRGEMNRPAVEYFRRGYEWRLMLEAKKRSPGIYLDCLAWGAPGWIGDGSYYSQDMADYIASYITGVKQYLGLDFDFTGIWNEQRYDTEWIKTLRSTLDEKGLAAVRIIGADENKRDWKIVDDINGDSVLWNSIYAIGDHYLAYRVPEKAKRTGKPIWAAEDGPWRGDWTGASILAKMYNRNYIEGRITKTITWSLVTSYYDNLPLPGSGLMRANEPWSGHFTDQPALWITAHTTQFAQPGWVYVDSGCGYLDIGGSYVTLKKPGNSGDFSIIIETIDAPYTEKYLEQQLRISLSDDLSSGPVYVWKSNESEQFVPFDTIRNHDRTIELKLRGNSVYSLTTVPGQMKGKVYPAPSARFPLPFYDDFESHEMPSAPLYFSDQFGVFEVSASPDGNKYLEQVITIPGISWPNNPSQDPLTLIGGREWTDYEIKADIMIPGNGYAALLGRVAEQDFLLPASGYKFSFNTQGSWELTVCGKKITEGTLPIKKGEWYKLKMTFQSDLVSVYMDDHELLKVRDRTITNGMAGLGGGLNSVRFDNFSVVSLDK